MSEVKLGIFARFRRYFLAGILVTSPILITVYVTWLIITFIDAQVAGLLPNSLDFTKQLPHQIPGLGLIISIIVITFIGAIDHSVSDPGWASELANLPAPKTPFQRFDGNADGVVNLSDFLLFLSVTKIELVKIPFSDNSVLTSPKHILIFNL